jgi:hypothetical protein
LDHGVLSEHRDGNALAGVQSMERVGVDPHQTKLGRNDIDPPRRRARKSQPRTATRSCDTTGRGVLVDVAGLELSDVHDTSSELKKDGNILETKRSPLAKTTLPIRPRNVVPENLTLGLGERHGAELHASIFFFTQEKN